MNRLDVRTVVRNLLNDIENSDVAHNWPDAVIDAFIQEALEEIAQRTMCNKDSISKTYCKLPLASGVIHYPFPDRVLEIESARRSWDGLPLVRDYISVVAGDCPLWERLDSSPTRFMTDFSSGYLSLVGKLDPVDGEYLSMTVYRLPEEVEDDDTDLDIPQRFHKYTYNWVMYRLLQKLGGGEHPNKAYGVEMSQRFLVAFEGNPSQMGYGGDIGKIRKMLNVFGGPRQKGNFF
jgi:hypothetical protein